METKSTYVNIECQTHLLSLGIKASFKCQAKKKNHKVLLVLEINRTLTREKSLIKKQKMQVLSVSLQTPDRRTTHSIFLEL